MIQVFSWVVVEGQWSIFPKAQPFYALSALRLDVDTCFASADRTWPSCNEHPAGGWGHHEKTKIF